MALTHRTFEFYVGDTWTMNASLHDRDGNPLDLTDAVVIWRLRDDISNAIVATATIDEGIALVDAVNGAIVITLAASATALLPAGNYLDEIRIIIGDLTETQAIGPIVAKVVNAVQPPTVPDLAAELEALKSARRSGVLSVRFADREVTYRSDRELQQQIAALQGQLGIQGPRLAVVRSSKGY